MKSQVLRRDLAGRVFARVGEYTAATEAGTEAGVVHGHDGVQAGRWIAMEDDLFVVVESVWDRTGMAGCLAQPRWQRDRIRNQFI